MLKYQEVTLPGGLWLDGAIHNEAFFKPVTGHLESKIIEIDALPLNLPRRVTLILAEALERIGSFKATPALTAALCVADRQFLMATLAAAISGDQTWLSLKCQACLEFFDISLQRSALGLKKAGSGYPVISLILRGQIAQFRVPTGKDQEEIANLEGEKAVAKLMALCLVAINDCPPAPDFCSQLTSDEVAQVEAALAEASPELTTTYPVQCPECGREQTIRLNPYDLGDLHPRTLEEETHNLAFYYHWSERDILRLTREKRRKYLHLIEQEQGFSS